MTNESIEFRRQIALAFTQAEIAGIEFNDVLDLVRNTAKNTAVPIDELAESTFDIFSTLTLDNIDQARGLLETFAESAVAGQAPIRDIGRAAIAWLNALDMAPTVENVSMILDRQFELVRKGAGTYTEFANVIGKAIPPFVAANQSVDELAGTIAFLTRNGLSAAEAATSASRAIELLFGPKAIVGLRKIGIATTDDTGRFRVLDEILADVVDHFSELDDAEKKLAFKEIFGQGRIQARRFFDLILREGNFEEFLFLLDAVRTSSGAVGEAFDIMTAEPAVQLDILRNRFKVLRMEIGDEFIPFLVGKLFPVINQLLTWWEELDDVQRENLVKWAAFATVFITVGGVLAAIIGGFILIVGLLSAFTGSLPLAITLAGGVAGVITAIAGAIALAIVDWEKFTELFGPWWTRILDKMDPVLDWIKNKWPDAWAEAELAYKEVVRFFEEDWPGIWTDVQSEVEGFISYFKDVWDSEVRPPWENFVSFIEEKTTSISESIDRLLGSFTNMGETGERVWEELKDALGPTSETIATALETILEVSDQIASDFADIAEVWGPPVIAILGDIATAFINVWSGAMTLLNGLLLFIQFIFNPSWELLWTAIGKILVGALEIIWAPLGLLKDILVSFTDEVVPGFRDEWNQFWETDFPNAINSGVDAAIEAIGRLLDWLPFINLDFGPDPSMFGLPSREETEGPGLLGNIFNSLLRGVFPALGLGRDTSSSNEQPPTLFVQGDFVSNADPLDIAEELAWRLTVGSAV
jgi:TP901 family phage tail tape measure protein